MVNKKIKILYTGMVLRKDWGGGEPIVAKDTIEELKKLGYEVDTAFYGPNYDSIIGEIIGGYLSWSRTYFLKRDSSRLAVSYYKKIIKLKNPDIIISQYDYDTSIIEAAKEENKKIIIYVHIWWPICPKMTLYTYDKKICNGYLGKDCQKCIINRLHNFYKKSDKLSIKIILYLMKILNELLIKTKNIQIKMKNRITRLNESDCILVLSEHMKILLVSMGVKKERINIIHNGIDCDQFNFNTNLEMREKIVLYMGGNNELKGYNFFKELALEIKKIMPNIRLIAAGNFNFNEYIGEIEYPGLLDREEVKKLIPKARVTFVPSIWEEPFAIVTIESMASGTPVVAFDVGILKEIIGNGIGGFIVPAGDIGQAKQRIIDLLTNDDLFKKMSKNARDRACKFYSNEDRISSLDKVIKKLIKNQ